MAEQKERPEASTLPESFQQRGMAAPFTTRVLSFARYRRSHGAADVLVPGLGGGTEVYVIPFKTLPSLFSMTVYDRAFHEQLARQHMLTPISMRQIALDVAETGLAGPAPMKRARHWNREQSALRDKILFSLIKSAVTQLGGADAAAHTMDEKALATPEGLTAARSALRGYAQSASVNAGEIIQRLEVWADLIVPAGTPDGARKGPLIETVDDIEALAGELTRWLIPEPPDTAEMAQRTATAARAVVEQSRALTERLHAPANAMAQPLKDWDRTRVQLARRVERLSQLIDGWQRILDLWEIGKRGDRHMERDTLETFAPHIPILPQEVAGAQEEMWRTLRASQARWIRGSQNRVDQDIDSDTRDKLSQFRKES